MRVTSVGQIPSERIWVGKCNKCNSEAEALEKELPHITYDPGTVDEFWGDERLKDEK